MLLIKSIVSICSPLIVIFNLTFNNNLINCEITQSHHANGLIPLPPPPPPPPLEPVGKLKLESDLGSTFDTIGSIGPIGHFESGETQVSWLLTTESSESVSTQRTLSIPSSISSDLDYYPQINGWCSDCCDEDEIFVKSEQKCLKRSFIADECTSSEQCIVPQSTCLRNMCVCIDYFVDYSRNKCTPIHNTAIEIYKITMIFASSCLALILLIFLACILRKSYCPADSSHHQGGARSTINDLFTIYPGTSGSPNELFSSLTPAEKPPSYSETMRMINQEIGTPPPAYHNIFYTETSSSSTPANQQNSNVINEQSSTSSQPFQSANCNNGLPPATLPTQSTTTTTINAQSHNLYSSLNQPSPPQPSPPHPHPHPPPPSSPPSTVTFNQGTINSAFDCDS